MNIEIFTLTLSNVAKILLFIALGYALRNSKSFPRESGKTLSILRR
jgi:predicted permease